MSKSELRNPESFTPWQFGIWGMLFNNCPEPIAAGEEAIFKAWLLLSTGKELSGWLIAVDTDGGLSLGELCKSPTILTEVCISSVIAARVWTPEEETGTPETEKFEDRGGITSEEWRKMILNKQIAPAFRKAVNKLYEVSNQPLNRVELEWNTGITGFNRQLQPYVPLRMKMACPVNAIPETGRVFQLVRKVKKPKVKSKR